MSDAQTVVVIDDDGDLREAICDVAARLGARAIGFSNGGEAMEHLERTSAPMVLLDLQMPGKDGWQVLWEMKLHPTLRHIPVTVMSGAHDQGGVLRAAGIAGFLPKPVSAADLANALHRAGLCAPLVD